MRGRLILGAGIGIASCLALLAAPATFGTASEVAEPAAPQTVSLELPNAVAQAGESFLAQKSAYVINTWYDAYSRSLIVTVPYVVRENVAFGPWTAEKDYGASDAREDGSLTEWEDNYFIVHHWSDCGQQILSMVPGDTVQVNGRTLLVVDMFDYPKSAFYEQVMQVVGWDSGVLQTCVPDSDFNRIVYGTWL